MPAGGIASKIPSTDGKAEPFRTEGGKAAPPTDLVLAPNSNGSLR